MKFKKLFAGLCAAAMVAGAMPVLANPAAGTTVDATGKWLTGGEGTAGLISISDGDTVVVEFTNQPNQGVDTPQPYFNFIIETIPFSQTQGYTLRADHWGWNYGEGIYPATKYDAVAWGGAIDWYVNNALADVNWDTFIADSTGDLKLIAKMDSYDNGGGLLTFEVLMNNNIKEVYKIDLVEVPTDNFGFYLGADHGIVTIKNIYTFSRNTDVSMADYAGEKKIKITANLANPAQGVTGVLGYASNSAEGHWGQVNFAAKDGESFFTVELDGTDLYTDWGANGQLQLWWSNSDNYVTGYTVSVLEHDTEDVDAVAADCVNGGTLAHQHCKVCGADLLNGEVVGAAALTTAPDPLGHNYTHVDAVASSCETQTDGVLAHDHCDRCGKDFIDNVEKTADELVVAYEHTWSDFETVEPTDTTEGSRSRHCVVCGAVDQDTFSVIPKLGTKYTKVDAKDATYEEDGNIEYYVYDDGTNKTYAADEDGEVILTWDQIVIAKLEPEEVDAEVKDTEGAPLTEWEKGSENGIVVKSPADLENLKSVTMDGQEVAEANYTRAAGSTLITFSAEYLGTLTEGEHTVKINSVDKIATGKFTVKAAQGNEGGEGGDTNGGGEGGDTNGGGAGDTNGGGAGDTNGGGDGDTNNNAPSNGTVLPVMIFMMMAAMAGAGLMMTAKRKEN